MLNNNIKNNVKNESDQDPLEGQFSSVPCRTPRGHTAASVRLSEPVNFHRQTARLAMLFTDPLLQRERLAGKQKPVHLG